MFHLLSFGLAILGGVIQLFSCGTRLVNIGVPAGIALSVVAVASGHLVIWRRRHGRAEARWATWVALAAGYASLFIIPIVGYGIIIILMGSGH